MKMQIKEKSKEKDRKKMKIVRQEKRKHGEQIEKNSIFIIIFKKTMIQERFNLFFVCYYCC